MNWIARKVVRYLLGDAAVQGITDEMMAEMRLAIREQGAALALQSGE